MKRRGKVRQDKLELAKTAVLDRLERAKKAGKIVRIVTIKPNKDTYIHVGISTTRGKRGGVTIAGRVHHKKRKSR